ncbi:hypothetical protein D3C81_810990 [compost metagenome]
MAGQEQDGARRHLEPGAQDIAMGRRGFDDIDRGVRQGLQRAFSVQGEKQHGVEVAHARHRCIAVHEAGR